MVIRDKFGMCWDPADRELAWALLREFVVSFGSPCPLLRSGCRHSAEGWRQLLAREQHLNLGVETHFVLGSVTLALLRDTHFY